MMCGSVVRQVVIKMKAIRMLHPEYNCSLNACPRYVHSPTMRTNGNIETFEMLLLPLPAKCRGWHSNC